jgi:hypothetical protein
VDPVEHALVEVTQSVLDERTTVGGGLGLAKNAQLRKLIGGQRV